MEHNRVIKTVKLDPEFAREVESLVELEDTDFAKFARRALRREVLRVRALVHAENQQTAKQSA